MKRRIVAALLLLMVCLSPDLRGQDGFDKFSHLFTTPKGYVIYQTDCIMNIDGKPDETSWEKIPWSDYFLDIEGDLKPKPTLATRFKMLWDKQNLYLYFYLEEPHVWAYFDKHDMIIFYENDVEVFIDPDRDTHDYYEFEINAINTLFDLSLKHPYRIGDGAADHDWNAKGFESAVHVDGTVNDPSDKDKGWGVEVKIPFSSLTMDGSYLQPEDGSFWKMNFSRVQWQSDAVEGKYVKRKNPETGKILHENNWVWSPQGIVNMHLPERWGLALFTVEPAGGNKVSFEYPLDELLARHLWLIFYKQNEFRQNKGKYAGTLKELKMHDSGRENEIKFSLTLIGGNDRWEAILKTENGAQLTIDQNGRLKRTN